MREIKFRAWVQDGSYWLMFSLETNNADISKIASKCPVMQYTGLYDKNGKEIYEGDIVKILYTDWGSQEEYNVLQVVYEPPAFKLMNPGHSLFSIDPGKHGWIEVIGNIYENPELVEGKQ